MSNNSISLACPAFSPIIIPQFWWLMNDNDRYGYMNLRMSIASKNRIQRNQRVSSFTKNLELIKKYAMRKEDDGERDSIRCLTCGIYWFEEDSMIAINTHQLSALMMKCKSSINGSLQKIGLNTTLGRNQSCQKLSAVFPVIKENLSELRKWTIRKIVENNIPDIEDDENEEEEDVISSSSIENENIVNVSQGKYKMRDTISTNLPVPILNNFWEERKLMKNEGEFPATSSEPSQKQNRVVVVKKFNCQLKLPSILSIAPPSVIDSEVLPLLDQPVLC